MGEPGREVLEVIRSQRACRSFLPDAVPAPLLTTVLEAATFAPSAENRQPWVFVIVRDEEDRHYIGELMRRAWDNGAKAYSARRLPPGLLEDVDRGATGGVGAAPVLVVACADTDGSHPSVVAASVFPAVQNLLLAASAVGLGSALTTLAVAFGSDLQARLGLPPSVQPLAVVPLGWPARRLAPPRRAPVAAKAHDGRFGRPWTG
ncbi:MAG: nitroreductase [Acidimicrobiales bacterium]